MEKIHIWLTWKENVAQILFVTNKASKSDDKIILSQFQIVIFSNLEWLIVLKHNMLLPLKYMKNSYDEE